MLSSPKMGRGRMPPPPQTRDCWWTDTSSRSAGSPMYEASESHPNRGTDLVIQHALSLVRQMEHKAAARYRVKFRWRQISRLRVIHRGNKTERTAKIPDVIHEVRCAGRGQGQVGGRLLWIKSLYNILLYYYFSFVIVKHVFKYSK